MHMQLPEWRSFASTLNPFDTRMIDDTMANVDESNFFKRISKLAKSATE